jgi:hypothetical protein
MELIVSCFVVSCRSGDSQLAAVLAEKFGRVLDFVSRPSLT